MEANRLLVLGLDAATLRLIEEWSEEGKLPVLTSLIREGASGQLLSTPNRCSPAAWTSFMTGVNPARHGIFFFVDRIPGTYELRQHTARQQLFPTIWELLSRSGRKVAVGMIPFTYPVREVNGIHIAGWFAPSTGSPGFVWPKRLQTEIRNLVDAPLTPNVRQPASDGNFDLAIKNIEETLRGKLAVLRWLINRNDWEFCAVGVQEIDAAQHYFWHLMDPTHPDYVSELAASYGNTIYDVYARIDEAIGDVLSTLDDDVNVLIMSDHGGRANDRGNTHLKEWLTGIGLLAIRDENSHRTRPAISPRNLAMKTFSAAKRFLQQHLSTTDQVRLMRSFSRFVGKASSWRHLGDYDWSRTRAFPFGDSGIWVNVAGREPQGIVASGEEYEEVRWQIKNLLEEARDSDTGKPVVKQVSMREEEHWGQFIDAVPDILVEWPDDLVMRGLPYTNDEGEQELAEFERGSIFPTGTHHREGCLILNGPDIKPGYRIKAPDILDLAPTILHLMGVPIPQYMEGSVLTEALKAPYPAPVGAQPTAAKADSDDRHEQQAEEVYSEEEAAAVRERLRDLGYID